MRTKRKRETERHRKRAAEKDISDYTYDVAIKRSPKRGEGVMKENDRDGVVFGDGLCFSKFTQRTGSKNRAAREGSRNKKNVLSKRSSSERGSGCESRTDLRDAAESDGLNAGVTGPRGVKKRPIKTNGGDDLMPLEKGKRKKTGHNMPDRVLGEGIT